MLGCQKKMDVILVVNSNYPLDWILQSPKKLINRLVYGSFPSFNWGEKNVPWICVASSMSLNPSLNIMSQSRSSTSVYLCLLTVHAGDQLPRISGTTADSATVLSTWWWAVSSNCEPVVILSTVWCFVMVTERISYTGPPKENFPWAEFTQAHLDFWSIAI